MAGRRTVEPRYRRDLKRNEHLYFMRKNYKTRAAITPSCDMKRLFSHCSRRFMNITQKDKNRKHGWRSLESRGSNKGVRTIERSLLCNSPRCSYTLNRSEMLKRKVRGLNTSPIAYEEPECTDVVFHFDEDNYQLINPASSCLNQEG